MPGKTSSAIKLVLLSNPEELRAAEASAKLKNEHGGDAVILSAHDAIRVEPALANFTEQFVIDFAHNFRSSPFHC